MNKQTILSSIILAFGTFACASATPTAPAPASPAPAAAPVAEVTYPIVIEKAGFATPESVLHDKSADVYLVSNINGSPFAADDNGFISQLAPTGEVSSLKWIDGAKGDVTLNAPKGMGIANGVLYVADIDHVRMFDAATGAAKGAVKIEGATFLNDIATGPDNTVYVSDSGFNDGFKPSGTDAVYQITADGKSKVVMKDESLGHPNGLLVKGSDIIVVTFGSGEIYSISAGAKRSAGAKPEKGSLDGVVAFDGEDVLISSWAGETIYQGPMAGPFTAIASGLPAPADIGWDGKRRHLLVPLFKANVVQIHKLESK
jgi:hypothetical protein